MSSAEHFTQHAKCKMANLIIISSYTVTSVLFFASSVLLYCKSIFLFLAKKKKKKAQIRFVCLSETEEEICISGMRQKNFRQWK